MIINLYKSLKKIISGINSKNTDNQNKNTKIKIINNKDPSFQVNYVCSLIKTLPSMSEIS